MKGVNKLKTWTGMRNFMKVRTNIDKVYVLKSFSQPISVGIVEIILLPPKASCSNEVHCPISVGIVPSTESLCRIRRLLNFPIEVGIMT